MLPRALAAARPLPRVRHLRVRGEKQHPDDHWLFYVGAAVGIPIVGYSVWKSAKEEEAQAAESKKE